MTTNCLNRHLDRIAESSAQIAAQQFEQPQIFVNGLLRPHEITTLIRDTEAHERALFTVAQPDSAPRAIDPNAKRARRRTTAAPAALAADGRPLQKQARQGASLHDRLPRRNTAVASVLGGDLMYRIQRGGGRGQPASSGNSDDSYLDVQVLLEGAEKLCKVYPVQGATERIAEMRARWAHLSSCIDRLEDECAAQTDELNMISQEEPALLLPKVKIEPTGDGNITLDDIRREETIIRKLEQRRAELESQVRNQG